MLMPSIFGENLFDDFFNDFPFYDYDKEMKNTEKKLYGRKASHVMKTDIRELDNGYEVVVDLPGFTKDEVQATLENGYLTISAEKGLDKDEKEKESYLGERGRLFPWCKVRIYVIYVQRSGISELQASLGRALSPPRKGRGMGPGAPYIDP